MNYHLLMLGSPTLMHGSRAVTLKSRKGQALLWYLAAQPATTFAREHLHALLWDDIPADAARRNFNTMLTRLRTELPKDWFHAPQGQLGWHADTGIDSDVANFLQWTHWIETAQKAGLTPSVQLPEQKNALHRAVSLWQGPFLDGFSCDSATYEQWMLTERHRWDVRMLTAVTTLIDAEKVDQRWHQVVSLARLGLQIDPLQEPLHRAIMEALFYQGNRSAALAQFELCQTTMKEQLDSDPDAATMALFHTIKQSPGPEPHPYTFPGASRFEPSNMWPTADPRKEAPAPPRVVPDHVRRITATMPPLVGRHTEYTRIADALRHTAHHRDNHVILLQGEAGIGKTRLLAEVVHAAATNALTGAEFPTLLVGRAYESMLDVPYAAFVDALDPLLSTVDLAAIQLPEIWLQQLGRLLPDVFVHRPDLHPPKPADAGDDRLRLFQAVSKVLSALPQPVLMAFDDLQWADPWTVNLLAYLVRQRAHGVHLAALVTVRTGDDSDALRLTLSTLRRDTKMTFVELANLTKDDTFALVETLFPEDGPRQAPRVYAQSLGHPLYTVELMNMLAETDDTDSHAGATLPVPPTVQDVFFGRLARLGDAAMTVAQTLALFRRGTTLHTLHRVTGQSEAHVVQAVDVLTRAHITDENAHGTLSFRHDVYRQVLIEKLSPSRLAHLHRLVYATLTDELPRPEHDHTTSVPKSTDLQLLADLVTHSVGGGMWEEALHRTQQAAAVAERLYAFPTALEHLNVALFCIDKLPDTDARRTQRLDIELRVAQLDTWSPPHRRDARLKAVAHRAREFGATSHLPLIHMAQAESLILQGRCTEAASLLEMLTPLGAQNPRLALGLHAWQGALAAVVGDIKPALAHLHRLQEAMGKQVLKPGTSAYAGMAACYAAAGNFAEADSALTVMKREEKEQGYQNLTSKFFTVAATVAYWRRTWQEAVAYAKQGVQSARAAEDVATESLSHLWLGAAYVELAWEASMPGETEIEAEPRSFQPEQQALKALEDALNASRRAQTYTRRDFIYAFLALAHAQANEHEQADAAIEAGLNLTDQFGYKEGRALCFEMQGRIAMVRGDFPKARQYLRQAQAQFETLAHLAGAHHCEKHLTALEGLDGSSSNQPFTANAK